jgi:hypothetical protein
MSLINLLAVRFVRSMLMMSSTIGISEAVLRFDLIIKSSSSFWLKVDVGMIFIGLFLAFFIDGVTKITFVLV